MTTTTRAATTTTRPSTTTTTTQPTSGTIVPAGGVCPPSNSGSTYQGNRLTQTQAVQALWAGGFRTVADLRAFVAIGIAESSLCVKTWHYHPEQSCPGFSVCADRGWLQINNHYWPQFPDVLVFDPVGGAQAAHSIIYTYGRNYSEWNTASQIAALQPSAAFVCSVEPATGC